MAKRLILSLYAVLILFVSVSVEVSAQANGPTQDELNNPNYFAAQMNNFVRETEQDIVRLIQNGRVGQHAEIILQAGEVIALVFILAQWAYGRAHTQEVFQIFIVILIVNAVFANYGFWTNLTFGYLDGLGIDIQEALTGTRSVHGPSQYIAQISASFVVEDFSLFDFNISRLIFSALLFIALALVSVAATIMSLWGTLGYLVVLPFGLLLVPTLLHHHTSFLFEGWFRVFIAYCLYGLVARTIVSVVALMYANILGLDYGINVGRVILLNNTPQMALFLLVAVLAIFLIFLSVGIVRAITNGAFQGVGGAVGKVASAAARAV
jgi:hypothetical protein